MNVGLVSHPSSLSHTTPDGHPERPDRIRAISEHITETGLTELLHTHTPQPARRDLIELVHESAYVDLLEELNTAGGGRLDADTSMGEHSLDAALRGSQGVVDATTKVLDDEWSSAFVSTRPPGHHATPSRAMGFCLTNHAAVAARWAIASGRVRRVAIFDWDAHHGNGTQDIFWADPAVLYISVHQFPWYPGTGDVTERGAGEATGTTINIPLPAGAGEDAYTRALDEIVEAAVEDFAPELVLVSAGYDAHHNDPLCMMRLSSGAFFRFAQRVARWGPGPVCVLEGGYDLDALAWSSAATVSALLGHDEPTGVPAGELDAMPGHPDAMRWVDRALAAR